jgi:phenylalanyl-tRNA synthetase beta chain
LVLDELMLDAEFAPGTPLADVLPISTDVLELEITPNRPDCLSVYGVAREVHAATGAPLALPPWREDPGTPGEVEGAKIEVQTPLCPRFTARVFEDVRIGPSPPWLKARLMAAGQRPISNVVDITNYVMLLTGQPLHAFDLDRVAGGHLTVRMAAEGEAVQTLDGQTRTVTADTVLIADADGPTSIAGIMGGARSEVEPTTTRVLLEAANWDGANVHRTSLRLGLRSEASGRFEKGLAPEAATAAQALATRLMIEFCDARVAPGTIDIGGPGPTPPTIRLRDARLRALLGIEVPRQRSRQVLEALDFTVADAEDGLDVTPPALRRADITREADVIEEVARLEALDRLPATLPSRHQASGALTPRQRQRRAASDALAAQGLHEVVGWSFTGREAAERLGVGDEAAVRLANPMSAEGSELRTTLLSSLLEVARRNAGHGATTLRLFEAGPVYRPTVDGQLPQEPHALGAVLSGPASPPTWRSGESPRADFFAAKGVLEGLFARLRIDPGYVPAGRPFLHPGRAAEVRLGEQAIGWLGELHPTVAEAWELRSPVAAFELDLDRLPLPDPPRYLDVTSFPEVREDLAVVVAASASAADVLATVRRAGAPLLAGAEVFDVYADAERIGAGKVSLALRLRYRAADRTLTDGEVASRRERIIAALAAEHEGQVRGG